MKYIVAAIFLIYMIIINIIDILLYLIWNFKYSSKGEDSIILVYLVPLRMINFTENTLNYLKDKK